VRAGWKQGALGLALVLPPLCVLLLLVVVPAITAVVTTFSARDVGTGLFANYADVFATRGLRADIIYTVVVTLVAVGVTFLLSYPLALYLRFTRSRAVGFLGVLFMVPLFVPVVITSFAMINFLVNHGFVSTILYRVGIQAFPRLMYNATGIVLTQVWASIPFAVLILGSGLQSIDDALIDSARDVGAGALRTFFAVILPLNMTSTMITLTLLFIGVFGSYTIPFLVGGNAPQMLGVTMTAYLTQYLRRTESVTMAVIGFLISALVGAVYIASVSRRERGTR
jgi:putative spermidine/putrescine transport system permease protein